jgi:hypothetical protein
VLNSDLHHFTMAHITGWVDGALCMGLVQSGDAILAPFSAYQLQGWFPGGCKSFISSCSLRRGGVRGLFLESFHEVVGSPSCGRYVLLERKHCLHSSHHRMPLPRQRFFFIFNVGPKQHISLTLPQQEKENDLLA